MEPKSIFLDGKKLTLKENGLPEGFGLFWKEVGNTRYIYVKLNGRGISCGTTDVREAVRFVTGKRKETDANINGVSFDSLTINDLLDSYIVNLEMKGLTRGEYVPSSAQRNCISSLGSNSNCPGAEPGSVGGRRASTGIARTRSST